MDVTFMSSSGADFSSCSGVTVVLVSDAAALSGDAKKIDDLLGGRIQSMISQGVVGGKSKVWGTFLSGLSGKNSPAGVCVCCYGSAGDVAVTSASKKEPMARKLGAKTAKEVMAFLSKFAGKVPPMCTVLADDNFPKGAAPEFAFGFSLRNYAFNKYKSQKSLDGSKSDESREGASTADCSSQFSKVAQVADRLTVYSAYSDDDSQDFLKYNAIVKGVFFARDLTNEPANVLTTCEFAKRISSLSSYGLEVEVLGERDLVEKGMNALLAVGAGSSSESYVGVMKWMGNSDDKSPPVCLVGKGVCFDSGGISIKPSNGMEEMISDMGGAAAVAGIMKMLALSRAPVNVVGLVGLAENMPSGTAQRPGDIVKSLSGVTIEVINTDAEGRMVLADVLSYAQEKYSPKCVVDFATLTGAIIVALGSENAGLFANDDKLSSDLVSAATSSGEPVWRMPVGGVYSSINQSRVADIKNSSSRSASCIAAAEFLHCFIKKDVPWAHLDIAGVAYTKDETTYSPKGSTGWGVMLFHDFFSNLAKT